VRSWEGPELRRLRELCDRVDHPALDDRRARRVAAPSATA
jgi:hypothetical protein